MRQLGLVLLILLGLVACEQEKTFSDIEGNFAVDFAAEPVITVDSFDTELGEVVLHSYMHEFSQTEAQMLTYSDYPVSSQYIKDPYNFIDGAKEGALRSLGITEILKDEQIELKGVPGVDVIGHNGEDLHIHYKLFLNNNRLYQIGFLKEGELEETAAELEFIESFVFLDL